MKCFISMIYLTISYFIVRVKSSSSTCMIAEDIFYDNCFACMPEYYSDLEVSNFENLFPSALCKNKKEEAVSIDIFVKGSECQNSDPCNGTISYPFDSLIMSLEYAHLLTKKFLSSFVNIYLIEEVHYITQSDLDKSSVKYFFRKSHVHIRVMPFSTYKSENKFNGSLEKPMLILKTNELKIFVSGSLAVNDIDIIGNDLALLSSPNPKPDCTNMKKICCNETELKKNYSEDSSQYCGMRYFKNYKNPNDWDPAWALVNIESLFPSLGKSGHFSMVNCSIKNFLLPNYKKNKHFASVLALIAVGKESSCKIDIMNISFQESFLANGVITFTADYYSNFPNIRFPTNNMVQDSEINLKDLVFMSYNSYEIMTMMPQYGILFDLRNYQGQIAVERFVFLNYYSTSLGFIKLFVIALNKNLLNFNSILIKDSQSHVFLECSDCALIMLKNLLLKNVLSATLEPEDHYLKISAYFIVITNVSFDNFFFYNSMDDQYCFSVDNNNNATEISNFFLENTVGWNIVFYNGIVLLNNWLLQASSFNQNIILFYLSSVLSDNILIKNITLFNNRAIEIITSERSDDEVFAYKICFFNRFIVSNYFVGKAYDYSQLILWSNSGKGDKLLMNNTIFENLSTVDFINDHGFFSSPYVHNLEFYNTLIDNFEYGSPPMFIIMYNFDFFKIVNISFKRIHRNRYYLLSIEGEGELYIYNMSVSDTGLHFDSFFIITSFLKIEYTAFTNIYSATRLIWYVFLLENIKNIFINDFTFISSNFSEYDPSDYDSPFGTNIINFKICDNIFFQQGHFEIMPSNTVMNELFLFSSIRNHFFSIKNISIINFNCLKGYSGYPIYENGVIGFVSSYSYIFGAVVHSTVILNDIAIQSSLFCKNGVLGFLNIEIIILQNVTTKNTRSTAGGALSFIYCLEIFVDSLIISNSEAAGNGGAVFMLTGLTAIFQNSLFKHTESVAGGTLYLRNIKNMVLIDKVVVENSFSKTEGGSLFLLETDCLLKNSSVNIVKSKNEGGGIYFKGNKNLTITDVIGFESYSMFGGFLFVEQAEFINMSNINNFKAGASDKGGCVLFYDVKNSELTNLYIANIRMNEGAGILYIENQIGLLYNLKNVTVNKVACLESSFLTFSSFASLIMVNTIFTSFEGALISLASEILFQNQSILIKNFTVIGDSTSDFRTVPEGLLHFSKISNLSLREVNLKNLFFKSFGTEILDSYAVVFNFSLQNDVALFNLLQPIIFIIQDSFFNLTAVDFQGKGEKNMAFLSAAHSELTFLNINLVKCLTEADSCIKVEYSLLQVENSQFNYCKASLVGVFSLKESAFKIKGITFTSNSFTNRYFLEIHPQQTASTLYIYNCTSVQIINCTFTESLLGVQVMAIFSSLAFNFTKFSADELTLHTKALWAVLCNIFIKSSHFIGFQSEKGGALLLENEGPDVLSVLINQSIFEKCVSDKGGVFFIEGYFNVTITLSEFFYNKALKINKKSIGIGGVGIYESRKAAIISDKLTLINNKFVGNWADSIIPTIFSNTFIEQSYDQTVQTNKFANNFDGLNFTENISSLPINLVFNFEKKEINLTKDKLEIVSGNPFSFKIEILDYYNQRLKQDNFSRVFPEPSKTTNFSSVFLNGFQKWEKSIMGVFDFNFLTLNAEPGSYFDLNISIVFNHEVYGLTNINKFSQVLNFYSRPCLRGDTFITDSKICSRCPEGKYSLAEPRDSIHGSIFCKVCPANAICPGGDVILPLPGYWRFSNTSTQVQKCLVKKACLGVSLKDYGQNSTTLEEINFHGICAINNFGPLCLLCTKNSAKLSEYDICKACEQQFLTYLKVALVLVLFSVYILFQLNLTMRNSRRTFASPLLKQLANHFQILGMIHLVGIDLSYEFEGVLKTQDYFLFMTQFNFPIDCLISDVEYNTFFIKVIVSNLAPFFFFVPTIILWTLLIILTNLIYRAKKLNQIFLSVCLIINLLLPQIIKAFSSLLNCISIDETSETTVLLYSPNVNCWEREHMIFILATLPGFICWGILFPLYLSIELYRKSYLIKKVIKTSRPNLNIDQDLLKASTFLETLRMRTSKPCELTIRSINTRRNNIISVAQPLNEGPLVNLLSLAEVTGLTISEFNLDYFENKKTITDPFCLTEEEKGLCNEINLNLKGINVHNIDSTKFLYAGRNRVMESRRKISLSRSSFGNLNNSSHISLDLTRGLIFKYLYQGYSKQYFYWEIIIYMKKLLLLLIGNLTTILPQGMIILLLIIILGLFMVSEIRKRPFITDFLNNVQFFSSLTIFFTVFLGILGSNFFLKDFKLVFFVLSTLINAGFLLYWGKYFWVHSFKNYRIFKCCLRKKSKTIAPKKSIQSVTKQSLSANKIPELNQDNELNTFYDYTK